MATAHFKFLVQHLQAVKVRKTVNNLSE